MADMSKSPTVNGVDKALEAVVRELDELPSGFMRYLVPNSGTYNCRKVAGSTVRSVHAWGAAIDINSAASDYWLWSASGKGEPVWRNRIPVQIVRIFEKHGFDLGRRLVSLRHHAFRISARAFALISSAA